MSIVPGTSRTDPYVVSPSTSRSLGLIGITVCPSARKARSALLPNFRRSLEAPTTAIVLAILHYPAAPPPRNVKLPQVQCGPVRLASLSPRQQILALLLLSFLTFFVGLGRQAITDSDEGFY